MDPVARQQPQWHFEDEQPDGVDANFLKQTLEGAANKTIKTAERVTRVAEFSVGASAKATDSSAIKADILADNFPQFEQRLRTAAEGSIVIAQGTRALADNCPRLEEGLKMAAEGSRQTADHARVVADICPQVEQGLRVAAEGSRETAEGLRQTAEAIQQIDEECLRGRIEESRPAMQNAYNGLVQRVFNT